MISRVRCSCALLGIGFLAFGSLAQAEDGSATASAARGFDARSAFSNSDIDHVNLFNGNLVLRIPVGQRFTVGPTISYQLSVVYNSISWDYVVRPGIDNPTAPHFGNYAVPFPHKQSNVGLGWTVSLGGLFPPEPYTTGRYVPNTDTNQTGRWLYIGPDGARHLFHHGLHPDIVDPDPDPETDPVTRLTHDKDPVEYTADGSYIRMRVVDDRHRAIDFPDGTVHEFECSVGDPTLEGCWRLQMIHDHFVDGSGQYVNYVSVAYANDQWTINDSYGRQQIVHFVSEPSMPSGKRLDWIGTTVFGTANLAHTTFDYGTSNPDLLADCPLPNQIAYQIQKAVGDGYEPPINPIFHIPLLRGIHQSDGSGYLNFTYNQAGTSPGGDARCAVGNGRITSLTLPTGAQLAWDYGSYYLQENADCHFTPDGGDDSPGYMPLVAVSTGVRRKRVTANDGSSMGRWLYLTDHASEQFVVHDASGNVQVPPDLCWQVSRSLASIVVGPDNVATANYFSIYAEDTYWSAAPQAFPPDSGVQMLLGWSDAEYGENFTRYNSSVGIGKRALYMQSETYQCGQNFEPDWHVSTSTSVNDQSSPTYFRPSVLQSCDSLRATYVAYENDATMDIDDSSTPVYNMAAARCTEHVHDGQPGDQSTDLPIDCSETNPRVIGQAFVYFDDGGNYVREAFDQYDGLGHHRFAQTDSSFPHTPTRQTFTNFNPDRSAAAIPTPTEPWILTTYDQSWKKEASQYAKQELCFDAATGFLLRERKYHDFGLTSGDHDVVSAYTSDANGHASRVRTYGGDRQTLQSLPSANFCAATFTNKLATLTPEYEKRLDYSYDVVGHEAWLTPKPLNDANSAEILVVRNRTVDPAGLVSRETDASGAGEDRAFDTLGRLVRDSKDGLAITTYQHCLRSKANCTANTLHAAVRNAADSADLHTSDFAYDDLGRLIESRISYPEDHITQKDTRQQYRYDEAGHLIAKTIYGTNPQPQLPAPANCSKSGNVTFHYEYDSFNRLTKVTAPDCAISLVDYFGVRQAETSTTVLTSSGVDVSVRTEVFDGYGRTATVTEDTGTDANGHATPVTTTYGYNVNNDIVAVDQGAQHRSYLYDAIGQKRQESPSELAGRSLNFDQYDSEGHSWQSTSAGGIHVLQHHFDGAGRLVQILDGAGAATARLVTEYQYYYSNPPNEHAIGHVAEVRRHNYVPLDPAQPTGSASDVVVRERFHYQHPAGLLSEATASIANVSSSGFHIHSDLAFSSEFAYDDEGNLNDYTYPDCSGFGCPVGLMPQREIFASYLDNYPVQISTAQQVLARASYWPNGQLGAVEHVVAPSSLSENFDADPNGLERVRGISVTRGATTLWDSGDYVYDAAGDVTGIGADQFRYDVGKRLRSASISAPFPPYSTTTQFATFDAQGNIASLTSGGRAADFGVDSATNRLKNSLTSTFAYDFNGNLNSWTHAISAGTDANRYRNIRFLYDALDMPSFARVYASDTLAGANASPSTRTAYVYGPDNRRVGVLDLKRGTQQWTFRGRHGEALRSVNADASGVLSWERDYVYLGDQLVAGYAPGNQQYHYFTDHLHSTRLVTDSSGNVITSIGFLPFGGIAYKSDASNGSFGALLFTSQQRDHLSDQAEDDLDYMLARNYAPVVGRFLSVDPVDGKPGSPQTWNRYSYVANNPLSRYDPTGQQYVEAIEALGGEAESLWPSIQRAGPAILAGLTTLWASRTEFGQYVLEHGGKSAAQQDMEDLRYVFRSREANPETDFATGRPKYGKDQVQAVWDAAKGPDGKVRDPHTGEELTWDKSKPRRGQWDMGHKDDKKYADLLDRYRKGQITRDEFLKEYRDPNNYHPESSEENQSHKWEKQNEATRHTPADG